MFRSWEYFPFPLFARTHKMPRAQRLLFSFVTNYHEWMSELALEYLDLILLYGAQYRRYGWASTGLGELEVQDWYRLRLGGCLDYGGGLWRGRWHFHLFRFTTLVFWLVATFS